eukprot:gene9104-12668_t
MKRASNALALALAVLLVTATLSLADRAQGHSSNRNRSPTKLLHHRRTLASPSSPPHAVWSNRTGSLGLPNVCNAGCIPEHIKLKAGRPFCCTEGHANMDCPTPAHYQCGAAGNSAAVFPMRRLGVNVWPLNTVQFSNHTQYGKWTGSVQPPTELTDIAEGIAAIDALDRCDAVLSGYLGSEEQGAAVLDVVAKVKAANPNALYCCDPVMGHPEK